MRVWHQFLIHSLPNQWLVSQHREVAALRGLGWHKLHREINYVFHFSMERLVAYHLLVIEEMKSRSINVDITWMDKQYRGKRFGKDLTIDTNKVDHILEWSLEKGIPIYPVHNKAFYQKDIRDLTTRIPDYNRRMKERRPNFHPIWFYLKPPDEYYSSI